MLSRLSDKTRPLWWIPWQCRTSLTRPLFLDITSRQELPGKASCSGGPHHTQLWVWGKGTVSILSPLPGPISCSLPFYFPMHVFPLRDITLAHVATLVARAYTPVSKDAQTYLSALCAQTSDMLTGVHSMHAQMHTLTNPFFQGSPTLTALSCDYW